MCGNAIIDPALRDYILAVTRDMTRAADSIAHAFLNPKEDDLVLAVTQFGTAVDDALEVIMPATVRGTVRCAGSP
jgi:hypothetical protein